jgi:hypothetical protein
MCEEKPWNNDQAGLKDKDTIVKIRNAENGEELDDIAYRERSNAKSRPSLFFWW